MTDRIIMSPDRIRACLTEAERRIWNYEIEKIERRQIAQEPGSPLRIDLPWKGCSTCQKPMTIRRRREDRLAPSDRTKGHLRPATVAFHPVEGRRRWAWQCHRCNHDQGQLTVRQWHTKLLRYGDARADRVAALIAHLKFIGMSSEDY